jgi:hypothetical protein
LLIEAAEGLCRPKKQKIDMGCLYPPRRPMAAAHLMMADKGSFTAANRQQCLLCAGAQLRDFPKAST